MIAFALAAAMTVFFVLRLLFYWDYWADPAHSNQPIEAWMTPGYVAYSHHVPKDAIIGALGLEPGHHVHITIEDVAARTGRSVDELIALLNTVIEAERQVVE